MYRVGKLYKANFYMNKKGTDFKREIKSILNHIYKEKIIDYPIKVHWEFYYKGNYGRDCDSGIKISKDSLQGVVYTDDNLIKKEMLEIFEPAQKDSITVKVYRLSDKELAYIEKKKKNMEV